MNTHKTPSKIKRSSKKPGKSPDKVSEPRIVRRRENKLYSVFIDGIGLDRATKRLGKKIDYAALLKSLCVGVSPSMSRYYTLLPLEDDSRQSSFLEAIARSGLDVIKKHLPPKGLEWQVATDVEMACDMLCFALGRDEVAKVSLSSASGDYSVLAKSSTFTTTTREARSAEFKSPHPADLKAHADLKAEADKQAISEDGGLHTAAKRVIVVVCPSKGLSYALNLCRSFGAETITADFGKFIGKDILRGSSKWVDLSFSETIWKKI